jgi:hypothetical protein
MKLEYVVHSAGRGVTTVIAQVEGEDTRVSVDALQVELTPVQPRHGSLNLSFIGAGAKEAEGVFKKDGKVSVSIEAHGE